MTDDIDSIVRRAAEQSVQILLDHVDLQIGLAEAGMNLPGKTDQQKSGLRKSIYNLQVLKEWVSATLLDSQDLSYIAGISSLINTTMFALVDIGQQVDKKAMDRLKLSERLETVRSRSMKARQKSIVDGIVPEILRTDMAKGRSLNGSTNAIATRILPEVNRHLSAQGLTELKGTSAVRERVDLFRFENGLA